MMSPITSMGVMAVAIFAGLAVLVGFAGVAVAGFFLNRTAAQSQERVTRWQENPPGMAGAVAAMSQEERARLVGVRDGVQSRVTQSLTTREQYEDSLPKRAAWKWFILPLLIPLTVVLLYTQVVSDIASFAAQGRAPQVATVLGVALALGLMVIPLFIRIETDEKRGLARGVWLAIMVTATTFLIGVAVLVAAGRGEAQFADGIADSSADLSYYLGRGDDAAAAAEQARLEDLKAQRAAVVDQDRMFAAGLGAAEAVLGWIELDALVAAGLMARRLNASLLDWTLVRKNTAIARLDRRAQRAIVRGATEAGVLSQLQPGDEPNAASTLPNLPPALPRAPGPDPVLPTNPPVVPPADPEAASQTPPASSTTAWDNNL